MEVSEGTSSLGDQNTLTLATMASEQEAAVMETVEQLQAGLLWLPHPKKVLKYMKRLNDVPVTVDILAETGIAKTVSSLCKYEEVGAMARNIMGRWKNLVPVDEDSDSDLDWEEQDFERSHPRKRPHDVFSKEGDFQNTWTSSYSQPPSPDFREKKHPKLWELERSLTISPDSDRREERKRCNQMLLLDCPGSGQVQSQPSTSLQQLNIGYSSPQEARDQKLGKDSGLRIQDKVKTMQERQLGEPSQVKPGSFNESREHRLLHQNEKYQLDIEGQKKNVALSKETLFNVAAKEMCQRPPSGSDTKEKQKDATRGEKDKESCSVKKYFPPLELAFVKQITKTKHQDTPKPGLEATQLSKDLLDVGNQLKDKGVSTNFQTQEGKYKAPNSHKSRASCLQESGVPEPYDKNEQPTTSSGSNFSYAWQPQRKDNIKIPSVIHEDKGHVKENSAITDSRSPDLAQKLPRMNYGNPEIQPSGAVLAKVKNISTHVTPHSGDNTLPTVQASCHLPSFETPLPLKPKKKTASSYHEEEGVGFTGRRMNSKMQVYSGPKCVYQPKLISLYQQCIRVLNNNLDSIFDVGNVPYTVLEPVLEKCTPKQLHRIEEYNQLLTENTDKLWKIHCNRDFTRERPREFESWKELYLRLQKAREQRLLFLTENIRSAHASKPKGRQTMMAFVNSVAKPPRDVRKKQEKFGTGRATVPEMIKTNPGLYTPTTHYGRSNVQPYTGASTSSTHSTPLASSSGSCDSRKTPVRKIAPMMAKTIKAFKNRFSR
ncbi:elongin-A-like [Dromiciops gliroides]|uniref:elongin-A-like n=1 Tax=Dromiciops gliroides TaxID=33562 RepID=UPI001CC4F314|nr:elongin-A-like [Dromiciops gliroides]